MPAPDEPAPAPPGYTFFMIAALLAVWGLVQDALHTAHGGSIDLRNRITGVRLAAEHRDPYFYKWSHNQAERFCDPFNSPSTPVSHTTVTPVTLSAFLPFKNLPYRLTQGLWFLVQYASLGLGFWAWTRAAPRATWLPGALLTCLFCLTPHWRLHVDRGQSYILYAALFLALLPWSRLPSSRGTWLEGLGASLLALLRPTYGILIGIPLARRRGAAVLASAAGLALWAALPLLLGGAALWQNYFRAMPIHAQLYLQQTKLPPARFAPSTSIEGIPLEILGGVARIPFADTSLYKLVSFQLPPALLLGSWALLAAASGFLLLRRGQVGSPRFWWTLSAWIFLGDYLLPAYRYPYNHALLWPVLLLGLSASASPRARRTWLGLSTALLLLHAATWFLPKSCIPWPGIASLFLAAGVALASFLPDRPPSPSAAP